MVDEQVTSVKDDKQGMSVKDMDIEIKRLQLEAQKLELLELQDRIDERKLKKENIKLRSLTNGQTLKQLAVADEAAQLRCNHRKGGNGQDGIVGGQGDDSQHSVIKHTFCSGDTWVRCTRCGKTWKPPIEENFYFDDKGVNCPPNSDVHGNLVNERGKFDQVRFIAAVAEYNAAVQFQTRNKPSSSYVFKYSDGGKFYRHITNSTTLR